jgi:hypothetical protein
VSDEEWIGNSNGQGYEFFQEQSTFDLSLTPPNGPNKTDQNILNNIRINIDSCSNRIRYYQNYSMIMQELNNEYNKLVDPISTPFHWSLSIYECNYDDENDMNAYDLGDEEYSRLTNDIRNRQNEQNLFKITHKSGREKYNINDFVVVRTGLKLI